MNYGFEIDPLDILGISSGASLQEIRDAYRRQSMKYHPDHGGEEWVFRTVVRAYEILSTARVVGRATEAAARPSPPPHPASDPKGDRVRTGFVDEVSDPSKLVEVELFNIRFEWEGPMDYMIRATHERNLSCCLNIAWPGRGQAVQDPPSPQAAPTLRLLAEAFETTQTRSRAISAWSRVEQGRFTAWLSYPTAMRAWSAFEVFHAVLKSQGLGVRQSTREMTISR